MKKILLAYSGGLDTTYCAVYYSNLADTEVHTISVNTGGFGEEEAQAIEKRALEIGVKSHITVDKTKDFYEQCIKFLVYGNILKNQTYPLSVSAERVTQAIAIAEYANEIGADAIAHGSTGAGNDQVRFDMVFNILCPDKEILTPVRDEKLSRDVEIEYLKKHGIDIDAKKAAYSINKGIWGTSVGGKETLNSRDFLPSHAWPTSVENELPARLLCIEFKSGQINKVDGNDFEHPIDAIDYVQEIAQKYGIGRDIHVGDTIIGMKGRVGFEAAAAVLIIKAHHALEKHVLTKWQLYWKDQVAAFYGNWLHEGQLLDPVMRDLEAMMESSQAVVNGKVYIQLNPNYYIVEGVESKHDLMSSVFGSYGEENKAWTGEDVKGFTKIFGNQVAMWHQINKGMIDENGEK